MQPLNNDIDELMRNAAAGYPVLPQGADWTMVAQRLEAEGAVAGIKQHGVLKKFLFLLPLLLAGFVCDRFMEHEYGVLKKAGFENSKNNWGNAGASVRPNKSTAFDKLKKRHTDAHPAGFISTTISSDRNRLEKPGADTAKATRGTMSFLKKWGSDEKTVNRARPISHEETQNSPLAVADTATQTVGPAVVKAGSLKKQPQIEKWYGSVLAGPDVSRVKAQKKAATGYTIGLLAGYNITKKWAVESGVLWARKNYFSKGAYFKTGKIALPQHSEVVQVDGYCDILEIPVGIRYNAIRNRKQVLFASAGISSYLMQTEKYNYVYKRYNTVYSGNAEYKYASKNWMSVASLSVGYEHRFGTKLKMRIEPYLKRSMRGVGIGSLPLNSTGVMVGITHPIQ